MNIFYLNEDPESCAEEHCDKHVVKMCTEYAQMLCTAHRVLDGIAYFEKSINKRNVRRWRLNDYRDGVLYKASHVNHPSNVWVRESKTNYKWLFLLWGYLNMEYYKRYNKRHKTMDLYNQLKEVPLNILLEDPSDPPPAMPDEYKVSGNSIQSYKNFYNGSKSRFAEWKFCKSPTWYTGDFYASL